MVRTPASEPVTSPILETERLILREMNDDDAAFMLEIVNVPEFIKYVGDRGVRTVDDAVKYVNDGPVASYAEHGFGLWLVELRDTGEKLGICGFVKRDNLDDVDIGFGFLPRYWSKGYAYESAIAAMEYGRNTLGFARIIGVTSQDNKSSVRLLEKIGLKFERMVQMAEGEREIQLFASDA